MNYIFLFFSALGFLDSSFLTIQHYNRDPFSCPLFGGCEEVTSSAYSEVLGVPIALLGAIYYATIFSLSLYAYLKNDMRAIRLASIFTVAGVLCSAYLVYLMFFVLDAICFYCLISAISSTLLFVAGIVNLWSWRRHKILLWKKSRRSQKEIEKS